MTESFQSTGTLSRILQSAEAAMENPDQIEEDEDDVEYCDNSSNPRSSDQMMEPPRQSEATEPAADGSQRVRRSRGPRLDRVLEDDDFIPELRLKNELLLK